MPHPKVLIDAICAAIRRDYPEPEFRLETEQGLVLNGRKDWRYQPDVQVFGAGASSPVCAVEIGYTRPEKLAHYEAVGIRDVRWYSKAGQLHAVGAHLPKPPVERRVVVKVETSPADRWRIIHAADEPCPAVRDALWGLWEAWEQMGPQATRFQKLRAAVRFQTGKESAAEGESARDVLYDHELQDALLSLTRAGANAEAVLDVVEGSPEERGGDSCTFLFGNGVYAFALTYCDVCAVREIEYAPIFSVPDTWADFIIEAKKQKTIVLAVDELAGYVDEAFAVALDFGKLEKVIEWARVA